MSLRDSQQSEAEEIERKRRRLGDASDSSVDGSKEGNQQGVCLDGDHIEPPLFSFKDFKLKRVLREDSRLKLITLHGTLGGSNACSTEADAVVLLERKPFDVPTLEQFLHMTKTYKETLQNDIYSTFDMSSGGNCADMKATLIYPATQKHIDKYTDREPFIVHETPQLYKSVTLPCIEQSKFSLQWVYNILDKKAESERIVEEDPDPDNGFVLIPDMKWDRKSLEALYLVAIVHRRGIRSIRDLRKEHLPLLENIMDKCQSTIKEKFGVTQDKLRVYFHYQPSYYHLHIHFTHVKFDAPGTDTLRAHLLQDVIDNIKLNSEYYSLKTLSYVVRENDPVYNSFKNRNYFT